VLYRPFASDRVSRGPQRFNLTCSRTACRDSRVFRAIGSTTRNGHGQVATNSASSQRRASRNIHDVSAILATAILREHLALRALRSAAV